MSSSRITRPYEEAQFFFKRLTNKGLISRQLMPLKPYSVLLLSYLGLRLIFQQLTMLKLGFIYPTGLLVSGFYDAGVFSGQGWSFFIGSTEFVLSESCSGTTFFCLLMAFMCFRVQTKTASYWWLLAVYPIAILANTIRVVSSMEAHRFLVLVNQADITDPVHTLVGSMVFLAVFLLVSIILDWRKSARLVAEATAPKGAV